MRPPEATLLGEDLPAQMQRAATDRSKPYMVLNRFQESSDDMQISWIRHDDGHF